MQIGHAGTLDPMATGLLIICTGKGTKAIDGFVAMQKAYSGTLRLGQTTPSYDAETDVSENLPWEHITGRGHMWAYPIVVSIVPGHARLWCLSMKVMPFACGMGTAAFEQAGLLRR